MINKERFSHPMFWGGCVATFCLFLDNLGAKLGVDFTTLTSWGAVWRVIVATLSNPVQLCGLGLVLIAVFIDPTTTGVSDKKKEVE